MQNILKCTLHVCKTLQNVLTLVKIDVLVNEKKVYSESLIITVVNINTN